MDDKSLRNLISFKPNYTSKSITDKQIKDSFKSVFGNGDDSNCLFFDSCDSQELIDLCDCFEQYLSMYPYADFRNMGIAKYITDRERYFLFVITDPVKDVSTCDYVKVNEEVTAVYQVREITEKKRKIKPFVGTSVMNKMERKDKDNKEGQRTEQMLQAMLRGQANSLEGGPIMICKSKVRVLLENYQIIQGLIQKAKERKSEIEPSEEIEGFIEKLNKHSFDIQNDLANMMVEIEERFESEQDCAIPYAEKLSKISEEADVLLNSGEQEPSAKEIDLQAQNNRRKIEVSRLNQKDLNTAPEDSGPDLDD